MDKLVFEAVLKSGNKPNQLLKHC